MNPIDRVLESLDRVKATGNKQWTARCPAHDDKNPSLSISAKDDGQVLVKCHAGCATEAVLAAVDLRIHDLFPDSPGPPVSRASSSMVRTGRKAEIVEMLRRSVTRSSGPDFALAHVFEYSVVSGGRLHVLRFEDGAGEKQIRQMSSADGTE